MNSQKSWKHPGGDAHGAAHALHGIGYRVSEAARRQVRDSAAEWLGRIEGKGPATRLTALDLALTCSGVFAQKSRSLFDASKLEVIYPFLADEMVETALNAVTWPGRDSEPKSILKAALSRQTPKQMVYRKKSAFVAPLEEQFRRGAFLRAFDRLNDSNAPLAPFIDRKFLRLIRPSLAGGERLPAPTASLVWTAIFVNQWLEQVQESKVAIRHPRSIGQI
jgi:asparagine synthetase B (glutamine-hydrolysing)